MGKRDTRTLKNKSEKKGYERASLFVVSFPRPSSTIGGVKDTPHSKGESSGDYRSMEKLVFSDGGDMRGKSSRLGPRCRRSSF